MINRRQMLGAFALPLLPAFALPSRAEDLASILENSVVAMPLDHPPGSFKSITVFESFMDVADGKYKVVVETLEGHFIQYKLGPEETHALIKKACPSIAASDT